MSDSTQPHDIYEYERARWINAAGKRKGFAKGLTALKPYLLIVIQVAMFLVSAKHTSDIINMIAPGMGWAGVVGFELGLVIFSLLIYETDQADGAVVRLWRWLEYVMVFMIVLSNIAGSIEAVVNLTGIKQLSFGAVISAFGGLSLTTQISLIVGLAFAVAVPLLFVASGQAFARIALSGSDAEDPMEVQWQSKGFPYVYRAFYAHYSSQGMKPAEAKLMARQMTAGFFGQGQRVSAIPEPPMPVIQALPEPSKISPMDSPKPLAPVSNEPSKRVSNAFQAALDAYSNGLSKKDVIDQHIAGKSTAYAAWTQFMKGKEQNK